MALPGFHVSEETNQNQLFLIVDKNNIFGKCLAQEVSEKTTTILVSQYAPSTTDVFVSVPYVKTIPEIPEGNYSHIFFVWEGKSESLHILEPLLQKAASDNAQFLFITDYHCFIPKLATYIHQQYAKASIILTGDVFGNEKYHSTVTNILTQAREKRVINLANVGLRYVYPALFSDVVKEILKVGFGSGRGKLFLACKQHGMTELSLAHTLQKVDPLIKVDFTKEEKESIVLPEGEYLFGPDYDVGRKLQDNYTDLVVSKKGKEEKKHTGFFFSPTLLQKEKAAEKRNKKRWVGGVVLVIFFLILPFLLTVVYAGLGALMLYATQNSLMQGDYSHAESFAVTSKNFFSVASSANDITTGEMRYALLTPVVGKVTSLLEEGSVVSSLLVDGSQAAQSMSLVSHGTTLTPQSDFLEGINSIKNALFTISMYPSVTIDGISLSRVSESLQPYGSALDIAPGIFGFPTRKTYLVLFQNNTELRPGGGFIGSYGLLTLQLGKITGFSIHNVYDADGQLKGHVEPPFVIRRYIPQQHWYLRDSNFDVDYSQDAASAAFFLQQETGQKVDGVIGVDLTFVKDILAGIGPIYLAQYNETVTGDNFFLLTEKHAEKNSFAGSTQKQDFLSSLFSAMQQKLQTTHGFSSHAILPLLLAVKNKDVLFGFSDPLIQDVFTVNGMSSTLWDGRKPDPATIQDFTGINEANIGVNKANYFITRSFVQNMTIDPSGSVSGKLLLRYTNTSTPGKWPGGDYKNYLRVILPGGATIQSIAIDGKQQVIFPAITDASLYEAKNFIAPKGLEVDSTTEEGKQMYGFISIIPALGKKDIEIDYILPQKINMTKPTITYNAWLFKQPGIDPYSYTFSLNTPQNFSLLTKPSMVTVENGIASFNKSFDGDMQFSLEFTQK